MTTQAQAITGRVRSGELQAFSTGESSTPAMTIGIVASTIPTANRKSGLPKSRRSTALVEPTTISCTSRQ